MSANSVGRNDRHESEVPAVTIIVVSYNTSALTIECLRAVYAQTQSPFELIVVDNASSDGSAEAISKEFPEARLIASETNLGFASANNLAADMARGTWILLLNSDTVIRDRAIDRLLAFGQNQPGASIFGGRTVFADGSLNPSSCWARPTLWSSFCTAVGLTALFRGSRWFDSEAMGDWRRDTVRKVDIVTGCFFLLRRADWERLRGFDPWFFMYGEEADLCLRGERLGMTCLICPDAEIIHYGGASDTVRADKMTRLFRAKAQLYARHWSRWAAWLGTWMLDLWALLRVVGFAVARILRLVDAESLRTWWEIWRNRRSWHLTPAEKADEGPHGDQIRSVTGALGPKMRHPGR